MNNAEQFPPPTDWPTLYPHPSSSPGYVDHIAAFATVSPDRTLNAHFAIQGDVDTLIWPERRRGSWVKDLWKTTCFELFARAPQEAAYTEFNFSPSSDWCAMRFDTYRGIPAPIRDVSVGIEEHTVNRSTKMLSVSISVAETSVPVNKGDQVGLTAVLEHIDGKLSYWALAHPGAQPDFHDARGFIQTLS